VYNVDQAAGGSIETKDMVTYGVVGGLVLLLVAVAMVIHAGRRRETAHLDGSGGLATAAQRPALTLTSSSVAYAGADVSTSLKNEGGNGEPLNGGGGWPTRYVGDVEADETFDENEGDIMLGGGGGSNGPAALRSAVVLNPAADDGAGTGYAASSVAGVIPQPKRATNSYETMLLNHSAVVETTML
jgi:hypothetical protein